VSLLESWGIWSGLRSAAGAIRDIHVSHRGHFGSTVMTAAELDVSALGYVMENHELGQQLLARATQLGITIRSPVRCSGLRTDAGTPAIETEEGEVITADLVLVAAGVAPDWFAQLGISVLERPTPNTALVFNASFPGQQSGRAFERFTENGPLAVLPLPTLSHADQRYNVVWSVSNSTATMLGDLDDEAFCNHFQDAFGWRLGRVQAVGRRSQWPLMRLSASEQFRAGFLLVGNAAHTLHPVAGQGLNLSLREAGLLAQAIADAQQHSAPIGCLASLKTYLDQVSLEQRLVVDSTDALATLFNRRGPLLDVPRDASLALLDLLPAVRQQVASVGTGRRYA
jgi:ubiquinone biosynthesis UbiH/UbiF/VisC/COQ6 family hydroxylase